MVATSNARGSTRSHLCLDMCVSYCDQALFMTTTTGNIFLNNFIMAAGARAHVSTVTGEVKMAAFTNNHLTVDTASGAVVLYEVSCAASASSV